ncbi:MAG: GTPase domain-containing protein [Thermodesulfobacteriota bacterium]
MSDFDEQTRTLTAKVVYYGPALSGKTTNLLALHDRLQGRTAGELLVLDTKNDRTLFFDLLPLRFRAEGGLTVRLKVFTVPGQVAHDATRKAVLSRADAVAFVADSQLSQSTNNFESFRNLEENAGRVGLAFDRLPLVVQYNKRDLPDVVPEAEVRQRWGAAGVPVVFSSALRGAGVAETFQELLRGLHGALEAEMGLASRWGVPAASFVAGVFSGAAP